MEAVVVDPLLDSTGRVLQELFVTEASFLRAVISLNVVWLRALRCFSELEDDASWKEPFDKSQVLSLLECQKALETIIELHRDLFAAVGDALFQAWSLRRLCQFLQDTIAKMCSSYMQYCSLYSSAQVELTSALDRTQKFDGVRLVFHVRIIIIRHRAFLLP
jgi:hypothetical protein